jgi:hypothetical protein
MKATVTSSGPGLKQIHAGIAALNGSDVLVGIPEANASRNSKGINNAELLFIFTNGSPLRGQPPRVVIEAAIEAEPTKELIAKQLGNACIAALNGDEAGMVEGLEKAGTIGESASKRWFTDPRNGWKPNAPSTIRSKGSDTPGIDTGQMRRAITHVVEAAHLDKPAEDAKKVNDSAETKQSHPDTVDAAEGIIGTSEKAAEGFGAELEQVGAEAVEGLEGLIAI